MELIVADSSRHVALDGEDEDLDGLLPRTFRP
jgi:hypothetical protein